MSIITHHVNTTTISQRTEDGYVNLTKMTRASGKLIANYLQLDTARAFLENLSDYMGVPISELLRTRKGGRPEEQGTWAHPQVAIHCAQWCSAEFAVLLSQWMFEWVAKVQTSNLNQRASTDHCLEIKQQIENEQRKQARLSVQKVEFLAESCHLAQDTIKQFWDSLAEEQKGLLYWCESYYWNTATNKIVLWCSTSALKAVIEEQVQMRRFKPWDIEV